MDRQKHLRFGPDQRLLLDTVRQYRSCGSESAAAAEGVATLGEQLLASYLAQGIHPQRCLVLLGALCAAAEGMDPQPRYRMAEDGRTLLRWHDLTGRYLPIESALRPWLDPEME